MVHSNELSETSGQDDAIDAAWLPLNNLPKLYASHDEIVARAIDYLSCRSLVKIAEFSENYRNINGGHMQYDKNYRHKKMIIRYLLNEHQLNIAT